MTLSLFRRTNSTPARRHQTTRRHFALESLEDRLVMSHAAIAPPVQPPVHVAPAAHNSVSVPINITGVTLNPLAAGQTLASGVTGTVTGTIDGLAFSTPLTLGSSTTTNAAGTTVPVLNLHLAPIDLNLLGLEVKTSEICLNITAQTGPGNLLGNLVGDIANLLNGTTTAPSDPIGTLTGDLTKVVTGATGTGSSSVVGLLNSALGSALGQLTASATTGTTNILHLSVGPLNLDLLGLVVNLDNCAGGPVTVDINAIAGPGNLLGNLLTDVANLLNGPGQHLGLLGRIDNALIGLIGDLAKLPL